MDKICLLLNENCRETIFGEKYYSRLRQQGMLAIYDKADFSDHAYVLDFVAGSNIIITSWGSPQIDEEILAVCPELKAVLHAAGSVKPVVSDALIAKNVRMTSSAIAIGEGVAETALGFAISACKRFFWLNKDVKAGKWAVSKSSVVDFYDIKIGVISGGMVGRHMVKLLQNFHVDILMYDPILTQSQISELGAQKVELEELMQQCDVVTIHAPSIPATDHMINKSNLSLLKEGAVLINTARGSIVNEQDLIDELKQGRIFACLDVTDPEPPAGDNELFALDNVIMTPHIAGTSTNGKRRIALHICEELERFRNGEKMRTEVDMSKLSQMA